MPPPEADSGPCLFVKGEMKCRFCETVAPLRTDAECLRVPTLSPVFTVAQEGGCCQPTHFPEEETDGQWLPSLPKVPWLSV